MNKQNIYYERERYARLLKAADALKIELQVSKLRYSQKLNNGIGSYVFPLKDQKYVNTLVGEVGLSRNDLFIPFSILWAFQFDSISQSGKAELVTYPLKANAATRGFINDADVEAFYNGYTLIKMANKEVSETFPNEVFRHIPETQPAIIFDAEGTAQSAGLKPQYDLQAAKFPLVPEYYIQGTTDCYISAVFNAQDSNFGIADPSAPTTPLTTSEARLVLLLDGVLLKEGADRSMDIQKIISGNY
ncbi:MAG: hypothetical protein LBN95_13680 [Prevotellaceae bacterium]|jgi:hypothetical protein|nr:hypothetical protein [Prevotellaceae bacterium]